MTFWNREPAVVIGVVVTIVVNILATLANEGFISEVTAGQITDVVSGLQSLFIGLLPLITAVIVRGQVYSPASFESK